MFPQKTNVPVELKSNELEKVDEARKLYPKSKPILLLLSPLHEERYVIATWN